MRRRRARRPRRTAVGAAFGRPRSKLPLSKGGGPKGRGDSAAAAAGFFLSDQKETKESPGDDSVWTLRVQIRLAPGPPLRGTRSFGFVVPAGAGDLRKAVAPYSLPLSSISGAGGSIGLQRAWTVQYTPLLWGAVTRRAVCTAYRIRRRANGTRQRSGRQILHGSGSGRGCWLQSTFPPRAGWKTRTAQGKAKGSF